VGIEVRLLELAMVEPIGTSAGTHRSRPLILVRVVTDEGEGWGECAALADGTSVDPPVGVMWDVLTGDAATRLVRASAARGGTLPEAWRIASLFGGRPADRMAAAALEMAVFDAELRAAGLPLVSRLRGLAGHPDSGGQQVSATPRRAEQVSAAQIPAGGPAVDDGSPAANGTGGTRAGVHVPVGAMVGIPADRTVTALLRDVEAVVAEGVVRVRVKIAPGWDVEPLRAVRRAFGDLLLQADANAAYRLDGSGPEDAARLAALDDLGLACVEQPLPPEDLAAHSVLATRLATPICLDESLSSLRRVTDAVRYGACAVACLKPARLGGLYAAAAALATCRDGGVGAFVGGFFESGLGRSANAALATLPGFTLPGDLVPPRRYLVTDPFPFPALEGGTVAVHQGPGVAPPPDPSVLAAGAGPADPLWIGAGD
jgi:O-succinylbenzoate synthase